MSSNELRIAARGATISTGASSASVPIPRDSNGFMPTKVRLAATAACYARLGAPSEASAVPAVAGTGYQTGDLITLTGGTPTGSADMRLEVTHATLASLALDEIGSGYAKDDVITLAGGTADTAATVTVATTQLASAALNAAGTGYAPGNVATLAGGTFSTAATVTVATTKVVSATVAAGGTGDLGDGAGVIVEGTTGTGTKFRASVTIATNEIASVQSITVAGAYSVNPTAIATEPVTYISGAASGTELTGAQLNVVMGVDTFTITEPGSYTVNTDTFTQNGATTPAGGTGMTLQTALYGVETFTLTEAGDYTASTDTFTQASVDPEGGTGATFDTASWGVLEVDVFYPGNYSVDPTNPVAQGSTTGSGVNATFTVTPITAAAAGDMLIPVNGEVVLDATGFDHVAAIQVSNPGVLQISPIE